MEVPHIKIGSISLYQFLISLIIAIGFIYVVFFDKRFKTSQKIITAITTIIMGFIGARVFFAIANYKTITTTQLFSTGFTYFKGYGALIFATLNLIVFCKIYKVRMPEVMDTALKFFFAGGMLAKIGCFFTRML